MDIWTSRAPMASESGTHSKSQDVREATGLRIAARSPANAIAIIGEAINAIKSDRRIRN